MILFGVISFLSNFIGNSFIVFFLLSIKRNSKPKPPAVLPEPLEPLEIEEEPDFTDDDDLLPGIKTNGFKLISVTEEIHDALELEEIQDGNGTMGQAFADAPPGDPQLLDALEFENDSDVVVEQNGVPYINSDAIKEEKNTVDNIDSNFSNLVKSVVDKEEPST